MKRPNNNKWLDELLGEALGSEKSEPNFEKWQHTHRGAVEIITSRAHEQSSVHKSPLSTRRTIMKSRVTRLTAAVVIIIAVALSINVLDKSIPTASAAQVLAEAADAFEKLRSVYIKAQMRTVEHDNFALIGVYYDFVPVEMWKEFDGTGRGRCRFEKPRRIVVTEGEFDSSLLLIKPNRAAKGRGDIGSVRWLKRLLDVDKVLDSEIRMAQQRDSELLLTHEKGADGADKLVVIVDALALGDFTNDWCKNSSIVESDNRRIYHFDAKTKLLEDLQVYVYPEDGEEVLVFEITDIQYNIDIDPALFTIELPDNVIWFEQPKELSQKYQQMPPKEVARAFFQACADEDWDEVLKFKGWSEVPQLIKDHLGGLEIIEIGEPFKSGLYPGWFVPYEIKLKSGYIRKMNLAVRNDSRAKRYAVDGGLKI